MQKQREAIEVFPDGGGHNGGAVYRPYKVKTTDATATVIFEIRLAEGETVLIDGAVHGSQSDASNGLFRPITCGFKRAVGGNVTSIGTASGADVEDDVGTPAVTVAADTVNQKAQVKVTGIAGETWKWTALLTYVKH
jgi:predicted deacylase